MKAAVVLTGCLLLGAADSPGGELAFVPPAPGTYVLQRILRAPEGEVLDMGGRQRRLSTFTTRKISVLSLVYTSCNDGSGCPLASHFLRQLRERVAEDEKLRARVRLVTLSFDPRNDTPEVMRAYAESFLSGTTVPPWDFLTTRSPRELVPLLRGLGQDVWYSADGSTGKKGKLAHLLKVFLIDERGWVREIYTTSFFQPQVVLNDLLTLLLEQEGASDAVKHPG